MNIFFLTKKILGQSLAHHLPIVMYLTTGLKSVVFIKSCKGCVKKTRVLTYLTFLAFFSSFFLYIHEMMHYTPFKKEWTQKCTDIVKKIRFFI